MPIKSRSVSGVAMCPQMKLGKIATARRDDLDGPDRLSIYEYMYICVGLSRAAEEQLASSVANAVCNCITTLRTHHYGQVLEQRYGP